MAKRFTEATKWADPWFRALPIESKCLWLWLLDNCDCAGIIEPDMGLATFQIGATQGLQSPLQALGDRVQSYGSKLFIPKFIRYQYGAELSMSNSAHRGVISRLEMAKIPCPVMIVDNTSKAPAKGLQRGYQAPQDKDKDKDTDKDMDKVKNTQTIKTREAIEIYRLYPKKVGKDAALKAIVKALAKIDAPSLAEAVTAFALAKKGSDPQYIPNPATWFNQCRWEDDRETWKPRPIGNFGVKKHISHNDGLDDEPDIMSVLMK